MQVLHKIQKKRADQSRTPSDACCTKLYSIQYEKYEHHDPYYGFAQKRMINADTSPRTNGTPSPRSRVGGDGDADDVLKLDMNFSPMLQAVIGEVVPAQDPMDEPNFDTVEYINSIFPDAKSLSELDTATNRLKFKINRSDLEILQAVREQVSSGTRGKESLEESKRTIRSLFESIGTIKAKAIESEALLTELCSDVKSLDYAKRNLTATISTLKKLQILISYMKLLKSNVAKKDYDGASKLLQAVLQLTITFENYQHIPKIRQITTDVDQITTELKSFAWREFENYLKPGSTSTSGTLKDACKAIEAMGPAVQKEFSLWFVRQTLLPYGNMFKLGAEGVTLEGIDRRFEWLFSERGLGFHMYENKHSKIFPKEWNMTELFTEEFCFLTRQQLNELLESERGNLNTDTLIKVIHTTIQFEKSLLAKFGAQIVEQYDDDESSSSSEEEMVSCSCPDSNSEFQPEEMMSPAAKVASKHKKAMREKDHEGRKRQEVSKWQGIISSIFDLYLDLFIQNEDEKAKAFVDRKVSQETWAVDEDDRSRVLPSSKDLISYLGEKTKLCASLSKGQAYYDMFLLVKKYLDRYANALADRAASADAVSLCLLCNTADYCLKQLDKISLKMKDTILPKFAEKIDLSAEQNRYEGVVAGTVNRMVSLLEAKLDPQLAAMTRIPWATLASAEDQSQYVNAIGSIIKNLVPTYSSSLNDIKHYWDFCDQFWMSFPETLCNNIFKCRQIGDTGVQQMIIDFTALRSILTDISVVEKTSEGSKKEQLSIPKRYLKHLEKKMDKADTLLKVILTPSVALVATYKQLQAKPSESEFIKIMEIKGITRAEQRLLLDQFNERIDGPNVPPPLNANAGGIRRIFGGMNLGNMAMPAMNLNMQGLMPKRDGSY
ncbi:heat-intolerant 1 [Planoprotostelium fungivorum]|uniref:Heat-intolerant 1 n=1 Tax=Planoprotostelium fungivorum TaxID=1890364 RepID=A0A2P6NXN3_9EUKA|nr:heat-intolerant 1 [Planoprotostelium fungivorum]